MVGKEVGLGWGEEGEVGFEAGEGGEECSEGGEVGGLGEGEAGFVDAVVYVLVRGGKVSRFVGGFGG